VESLNVSVAAAVALYEAAGSAQFCAQAVDEDVPRREFGASNLRGVLLILTKVDTARPRGASDHANLIQFSPAVY